MEQSGNLFKLTATEHLWDNEPSTFTGEIVAQYDGQTLWREVCDIHRDNQMLAIADARERYEAIREGNGNPPQSEHWKITRY